MSRAQSAFRKLRKVFAFLVMMFVLPSIAVAGVMMGVLATYSKQLPDVNTLLKYKPIETTRIYSSDGTLIAELYEENRTWVPLEVMPEHLIDAILSIEDDKFWDHPGVSIKGMGRALWANIEGKEIQQGGSTITMQLARNLFLSSERSYKRKITEILLAIEIERHFTKEEILELYLNQIPLGSGTFGVEAASQIYFGKSVADITLNEAAVLAGLPQAPSLYSPYVDIEAAKKRRNLVLQRMMELGKISAVKAKSNMAMPVEVIDYQPIGFKGFRAPYFSTYCLRELVGKYGSKEIYRGGLSIYSTLDLELQEYGEECIKWGVDRGIAEYAYCDQGAMVCIENNKGYIRAMVGGYDYKQDDQFNRAWQAKRQPGSSFKIIVYTAAVDNGFTPNTICQDTPVVYKLPGSEPYKPMNSDHKFYGPIPLRDAVRFSRNVVAVKTMVRIGIDTVIDYAHRMGIEEELPPVLSLALGAATVSPLEMATVASVLPSKGMKYEPTTIKKIFDSEGNIIEDNTYPRGKQIVAVDTAYSMIEMLKGVISSGTGTNAYIGRPAGGKTGTTSDFKDAWFVGFTPHYSLSVWIGRDDNKSMNHVFGGDYPAMTWARFMKKAHENIPVDDFSFSTENMIEVKICPVSGLLAGRSCPGVVHLFEPGTEPQTECTLTHRQTSNKYLDELTEDSDDGSSSPPPSSGGGDSGKIDGVLVEGVVVPAD